MPEDPLQRYHRQILLPHVAREGQERLARSHALIVGCGALGCVSCELLARAGVGRLTIVDRDLVELTNLQRQMLFNERHVRDHAPKADAAAQVLRQINADIQIEPIIAHASHANIHRLAGLASDERPRADIILDGTDNFETRYLLNDLAIRHAVPFIYAGAVACRGMGMTIIPEQTPCLRCLFEDPPVAGTTETCDTVGVWGPAVVASAAIQASEALKVLLQDSAARSDDLIDFDMHTNTHRALAMGGQRREDCPCCGHRRFPFLEGRRSSDIASLCGRDAYQISPHEGTVDLAQIADRLAKHGEFTKTRFLVRGVLNDERGVGGQRVGLTVFGDGRGVVSHARDEGHARAVYSRYVGG